MTSRALGLLGLVAGVGCGVGFVAATVRADRRLADPAASSGFRGAPVVWAVAALLLVVGSLIVLGVGVAS